MTVVCNNLAFTKLIALCVLTFVNGIDINVNPQCVRPNDKNVVFTCVGGNETNSVSKKMIMISLMKVNDHDQWTAVAVLRSDGSIEMTGVGVTAAGRLGSVPDSYLAVTWPVAPNDINGRYRCNGILFTAAEDTVTEESRVLDARIPSNDWSKLLERIITSEENIVEKVNETIHGGMWLSKSNLISVLNSKFEEFKIYFDNKTEVQDRKPEVSVETTMRWPEGNFTLLMPDAGCPRHPPAWIKSFLKIKAVSGDTYYPIDTPLHLAKPHKKDEFIYRQFCTLPASPDRTKAWPAGTYCLHEVDLHDGCPTGFEHVDARVKVPSDKRNLYLYYLPNNLQISGYFRILSSEFCCRHDGNATTPIDLPVSHPFYLKRHRGRCQEVKGMDVTQDAFMMETLEDDKYDKWVDTNVEFYPDVTFNPYKEELCHYTKKSP